MMEIENTADNSCCFVLKSSSGKTLFQSREFQEKQQAERALENLPELLKHPGVVERMTDHQGRFLVMIKDLDGRPLGESQRYDSEAGMENGLKNILRAIHSSPQS